MRKLPFTTKPGVRGVEFWHDGIVAGWRSFPKPLHIYYGKNFTSRCVVDKLPKFSK